MNDSINKYRQMYGLFDCSAQRHVLEPAGPPDESPRASAVISRENALNHLARASRKLNNPRSHSVLCRTSLSSHEWSSLCVVALRGARRGAWRVETWRDGRGDAPCCFSRYVRIVARTAFAVLNNIYSVPAYVVWMMALRLIRPLYAPLYWKIEGLMYHWLLAMVSLWSWTAGYRSKSFSPTELARLASVTEIGHHNPF